MALDVFGAGIEVRPLKAPGVCFICESTPVQDTDRVINTMRIFSPGPMTNLNGTKYVCGSCAHDLGVAIGLVDPVEFAAVSAARTEAEAEVANLTEKVNAFSALEAAVATLTPTAIAAAPAVEKAKDAASS